MYYRKEYKYQAKLGLAILLMISTILGAVLMLVLAYKNNTILDIDGIEFYKEASTAIFGLLGIGCILGTLSLAYSSYLGWKVGRSIVLANDEITFPKSKFSAEKVTKKYSEISLVSQLENNGNVFVRVNYIDGTNCELSRILFTSTEEYLDFISNLTELIKANRAGQAKQ